jgi:hypothetical protein
VQVPVTRCAASVEDSDKATETPADESTAVLDGHRGRQAMEVLRDVPHEHGIGVIIVTRDHRTLEVFDSIYEMGDGSMFRGGRPLLRRSAGKVGATSSTEVDRFWVNPYSFTADVLSGGLILRSLLASVTAVMLFTHAVLGCCAHHIHACGDAHGSVALGGSQNHCSLSCGDHSAESSGQADHEHQQPGQDDCQGSRCDFGRPTNDREADSGHVWCQSVAVLLSDAMLGLAGSQVDHHLRTTGILLPVRLHLVHQVLLI